MTYDVPAEKAIMAILRGARPLGVAAEPPGSTVVEELPVDCRLHKIRARELVFVGETDLDSPLFPSTVHATFHWDETESCEVRFNLSRQERNRQNRLVLAMVPDGSEENDRLWRMLATRLGYTRPARRGWPKLPGRTDNSEQGRLRRLSFIEEHTGAALSCLGRTFLQAENMQRTVESFVGSVEVPVGIAGPLLFDGKNVQGFVFAPMATTEGSLVASATRGAAAVTAAGGVRTCVLGKRLTRVPMFQMRDVREALLVAQWLAFHFEDIRAQTLAMSRYADLKSIEPQVMGRDVHVHFVYETGDAAGQNMTTGCTWQACQWIIAALRSTCGLEVQHYMIEANLSSDKKVTNRSFIQGRGTRVVAECSLPGDVTSRFLHATPEQLVRGYNAICRGGIASGMVGSNVNIANIVAAIFTATGQDIASVHESSIGQLTLELEDNGNSVYASMHMPSLLVGSVGGGTSLPDQRDCMNLMQTGGSGGSERLAEIICGFALSLDLSTLAALSVDEFAASHHPLVEQARREEKVA
jgi:NADP-dependent 3-hydroxy-3-methylglutaryl-CoA reductase